VLVALAISARARIDSRDFAARGHSIIQEFAQAEYSGAQMATNEEQQAALHALERATEAFQLPSQRLEHALHGWVAFAIMPLFALANAGVPLGQGLGAVFTDRVALGVMAGLVIGKPVGILLLTWVAARLRMGMLPLGVGWPQLVGMAWLGGIGFTMSLFIADLAFGDSGARLTVAKAAILLGSLVAGSVGWLLLRSWPTAWIIASASRASRVDA
jgi:Na+:H+ antiporter, NhaA family